MSRSNSDKLSTTNRTHESTQDLDAHNRTIDMESGEPIEVNEARPLVQLEPDQKLGKYVIRRMLGQGAMGAVYLAFDPVIEREVAIKVLPRDVADNALALSRFLTEARSTGKLNHPHVVSIFDIAEQDGLHFIVMELLTGGTPGDGQTYSWMEACRIVAEAAAGLAAAHEEGLVHRDVKPDNLMLSKEGIVKVVDFGLSKLVDAANDTRDAVTRVGAIMGTPQYMSPEQCEAGAVDHRSDVYSLGGTLFRLLTGRLPYEQCPSFMQVLMAHVNQPVPDPLEHVGDLPKECGAIVARAMAKAPQDRYQSAADMEADLRKLIQGNQSTCEFVPKFRPFGSVLIVEPSKMQTAMQRDSFDRAGVPGIRSCETLADAQEMIRKKLPDVVLTAMTLSDGRGFDLLQELGSTDVLSATMQILNTSDFSLADIVDLGLTGPLAVVSKKSKPVDVLKAIHACSWCSFASGPFSERASDIAETHLRIVCDSDRIPDPIAEQVRRLGLMKLDIVPFGQTPDSVKTADLTLMIRTAGTAENDSSLYAGLLSRVPNDQAVAALQVDGPQVTLRAMRHGAFAAVTRCEFDDERLDRVVRILQV